MASYSTPLYLPSLSPRNKSGKSALSFVMKYVPNSLRTIEERMDSGIQMDLSACAGGRESCGDATDGGKVKMNFNLLIPSRCAQNNNLYTSEVGLFTEILQLHNNEPARLEKILGRRKGKCGSRALK